jgi:hypothetical protein
MNVRNFSDLDDILIDASENDDNYQNSGYEYDEDFEQEESPAKDQAKLQRQARSNFDDTNFGGDNHDEDYTLDQGEQQATFTEFEAVIDLKEIVDPNEDQDELTSDNASPKLLDAPEKKLDVLIEINVPSPDDKMNSFELQGEIEAVTENTFVNQLNRSNVPPRPNVITSRNEYIGNKNQFSHVRKVSDDDGTFILNQQKKKINNGISGSGTDSCKGKEENVHTLQEMIEIAAEKISIKNIAMSSLASRAIPVPAIQLGISNGHNRDLFGISYYNPDYDSAVEMMQKKLIHNPSLTHEGYNSTHARSSSYRGSNDNPYDNDQQNLNRNSDSRKTFTNNDHTALLKDKSFTPNRQTTTLESHRGEETVISLIEEINTEKENLQLLRLGVDRNMLCNKSEEIHSSFLRDLIGKVV